MLLGHMGMHVAHIEYAASADHEGAELLQMFGLPALDDAGCFRLAKDFMTSCR